MAILEGVAQWWASFVAPDDGKLRNAANINVALSALADRTAFLYARRLVGVVSSCVDSPGAATGTFGSTFVGPPVGSSLTSSIVVADVAVGDVLIVHASGCARFTGVGGTEYGEFRIVYTDTSGTALLPGSRFRLSASATVPFAMSSVYAAAVAGSVTFALQFRVNAAAAGRSVELLESVSLHATRLRA